MKTDKGPNASLPWVIVFASAAMTLASATSRPGRISARPAPTRVKPAAGTEPECGGPCPCPLPETPDPAARTLRRETWIRA